MTSLVKMHFVLLKNLFSRIDLIFGLVLLIVYTLIGCDLERIDDMTVNNMNKECVDPADYLFETSLMAGILDSATSIIKSDSGEYYITGYTEKQGEQLLLYKTNLCRENLLYLGIGSNISKYTSTGIALSSSGDIVIAGLHHQFLAEYKGYVARVSPTGVIVDVWNEFFDKGLKLYDLESTNAGTLLLGGSVVTEGGFGDVDNGFIMLMTENFDVSQSVHFPTSFSSNVNSVLELPGGKFIGIGTIWVGFGQRIFFAQTNTNGDVLTNMTLTFNDISGDNNVYGSCAAATSDGNVLIAGYYNLIFPSETAAFIKKVTTNGTLIWEKEYTNQVMAIIDRHIPASVIETSDGGFLIVGTHKFNNPNPDVFLLKINVNGEYEWDQSYGGSAPEYGTDVIEETDGGYVVTGYTESYNEVGESGRIFLLKTDSNGNVN